MTISPLVWCRRSLLGGGIYFQEFDNLDLWNYFVYVIGILIIFYGVYGLSPDPPTESQRKVALTLPVSTIFRAPRSTTSARTRLTGEC